MSSTIVLFVVGSLVTCYVYYVAHTVVLHNCAHYSLFRSRRMNALLGNIICSVQGMHFEGWRIAHMLHHRFANTERDPHCVDRPLIPYILTHYLRIAMMLGSPLRLLKSVGPTLLIVVGVIVWQASAGHWMRGLACVAAFWAVPVLFSQAMVAHFNYITHVGLSPGRGRDTRNLTHGIWPLINFFTFNLYLHLEHHLRPGKAIPQLPERPAAPDACESAEEPPSEESATLPVPQREACATAPALRKKSA